jgi:two-component system response regulator MprA
MYPVGTHILVIDSDAARRQLCARVLADEGFTVTVASEGLSAIRAANGRRFALAVAALRLPGSLDGLTVLRLIRARQPALKALYTGPAARRPRLSDGTCDDFIPLPFQPRELLGCVFELLQRTGAAQPDRGIAG